MDKTIRQQLAANQKGCCYICGQKSSRLEIEHFVPKSKGGNDDFGNLYLACPKCNKRKAARQPQDYFPKPKYRKFKRYLDRKARGSQLTFWAVPST